MAFAITPVSTWHSLPNRQRRPKTNKTATASNTRKKVVLAFVLWDMTIVLSEKSLDLYKIIVVIVLKL